MRRTLVAIDAGGSTTRANLVDMSGRCLGQGRSRGGNPASNDPDFAASAMIAAVEEAIAAADAGPLDIGVVLMAHAGPPVRIARDRIEQRFRSLGLSGPITMVGDLLAMFASATPSMDGYCIVAGTGAGAVRIRAGAIDGVADASGWLLGDLGSGYWLGHEAAKAASADLEGRGEPTALTAAIIGSLGIEPSDERINGRPATLRRLIEAVYTMRPIELAQFAPLVIAHRSDPVASRLIARAEDYLLADLRTVFDAHLPGPVGLGGGVIGHLTGLPPRLAEFLRKKGHEPDIRPVSDGSVGAIVLALRAVGVTVDEQVFRTVVASLATPGSGPATAQVSAERPIG